MNHPDMTRRGFLQASCLGTAAFLLSGITNSAFGQGKTERPNIVFIMADDVGCEALGCYGGTSYNTPNLDILAETGIRFTHCYSSPVCAPTRVKIMTGRYGFRNYKKWGHIRPDEITFGHVLKGAGYATALSGKWQMCLLKNEPNHIGKMGFEQNCCFGWHEGPRYYQPLIWQNGKIRKDVKDQYGPDVYCQFLIDFIERNKDKPFLAYYPMAVAHAISNDLPVPPPKGPLGRYKTYKELVEYMDRLVGRIVRALDRLKLRRKTIILFTGDNGTPDDFITKVVDGKYINEPIVSKMGEKSIRGGKGKLTDAGTRVPLIANWPGKAPAGKICDDLIDFSDFLPTFSELAGAQLPKSVTIDGRSFAPQLKGQKGRPRQWAYCQWQGKAWIRTKRWKLYADGRFYDIRTDEQEKSPIPSGEESPQASAVKAKLRSWLGELKTK